MLTTEEVRAAFVYARNDQDYVNPADEEARFDDWLRRIVGLNVRRGEQAPKARTTYTFGATGTCALCAFDIKDTHPTTWPNDVNALVHLSCELQRQRMTPVAHVRDVVDGEIDVCATCPRNVYGAQIAWDDPHHAEAVRQRKEMCDDACK